ncbi:hypothetical protein [Marinivivus vitaminiproducens]|uniref:hypothetical protein n=1 Tax=Marinivivus vitaminiproducens TaxID=3035935 RepID=UPI0027A6508D|nr:hypothetical protein P4R82_24720 [Geminicoccaceae bacterium SCSIO 64248]
MTDRKTKTEAEHAERCVRRLLAAFTDPSSDVAHGEIELAVRHALRAVGLPPTQESVEAIRAKRASGGNPARLH